VEQPILTNGKAVKASRRSLLGKHMANFSEGGESNILNGHGLPIAEVG
jgi:hypothetical protein